MENGYSCANLSLYQIVPVQRCANKREVVRTLRALLPKTTHLDTESVQPTCRYALHKIQTGNIQVLYYLFKIDNTGSLIGFSQTYHRRRR